MNTSECTKMRAECVGSIIFRTTALARRIWQKKSGEEPIRVGMLKITDTVQIFLLFFFVMGIILSTLLLVTVACLMLDITENGCVVPKYYFLM